MDRRAFVRNCVAVAAGIAGSSAGLDALAAATSSKDEMATWITRLMESHGLSAHQIAYCADNKKRVSAVSKAVFGEVRQQPPYFRTLFRTLHSIAYRTFQEAYPDKRLVSIEYLNSLYADTPGMEKAVARYTSERWATSYDPMSAPKLVSNDLAWAFYHWCVGKYETLKRNGGLIDFTDLLTFAASEAMPQADVRFAIYEGRELYPLYRKAFTNVFSKATRVILTPKFISKE